MHIIMRSSNRYAVNFPRLMVTIRGAALAVGMAPGGTSVFNSSICRFGLKLCEFPALFGYTSAAFGAAFGAAQSGRSK